MNNFTISSRKYRPNNFNEILGQNHIITTIKNAIKKNKLAQSLLFCGPRGVGKTTSARILAKTINCKNINNNIEPCNLCSSCKNFNNKNSLNIYELDAASNNSVEDIRSLINQINYIPQYGKYKIYIIDEVHMLSNSAFNAFLKTLEEPPKHVIFILVTTNQNKIIPTILSRCQIFNFYKIKNNDIVKNLKDIANKEDIKYEEDAIYLISEKCDGSLRDALSMFDLISTFEIKIELTYKNTINQLNILDNEYYFKITNFILKKNLSKTLIIYNKIIKKGFNKYDFITGLNEHLRNLVISKDIETIKLLNISKNLKYKYKKQSKEIDISFLINTLNIINKCEINYNNIQNKKLHIEITIMKIVYNNKLQKKYILLDKILILNKYKISEKNIKKYWNEYLINLNKKNKKYEYEILKNGFNLESNNILIKINKEVKKKNLKSIKYNLLKYLNKKVNSKTITIPKGQKFNYLLKKNPFLMKFKEML